VGAQQRAGHERGGTRRRSGAHAEPAPRTGLDPPGLRNRPRLGRTARRDARRRRPVGGVRPALVIGDDAFAAELRGFGPAGIAALLVIVLSGNLVLPGLVTLPVGGILALIWARWSHTP